VHAPPWQVSVVQVTPSSQAVPFATGVGSHASVASLQVPVLQALAAAEQSRAAPVQAPAEQASLTVQNWPSSQVVPSAAFAAEQEPSTHVCVLQAVFIPAQSASALHAAPTVSGSTHAPARHTLPSEHSASAAHVGARCGQPDSTTKLKNISGVASFCMQVSLWWHGVCPRLDFGSSLSFAPLTPAPVVARQRL
jgi:hypothetical protein